MRSLSLITIWPAIHFYSKLTISLLTIFSKTGPSWPGRLVDMFWAHVIELLSYLGLACIALFLSKLPSCCTQTSCLLCLFPRVYVQVVRALHMRRCDVT